MKQLYLPFRCDEKKKFILEGSDFHYLFHVLRFEKDETFYGIDAAGKRYLFTIESFNTDSVLLNRLETDPSAQADTPESGLPPIILFQSLPKGKAMDRIVRCATEIGVTGIVPVISRYTVVAVKDGDKTANKLKRWMTIVKEAIQQSGSVILPYISEPLAIIDAIRKAKGIKLFFHQDKIGQSTLHGSLAKFCREADDTGKTGEISVFIGCEGGFSEDEVILLKQNGFIPINVGMNVLRADTAALFALSAVKVLLLEKEKWRIV
jgi:16S rRNA (uracil1498-N3)-methyltransferase